MDLTRFVHRVWDPAGGVGAAAVRTVLLPASAVFRVASAAHRASYDRGLRPAQRVGVPVISVGNLRVGGAGKTPFTGWVVDRLVEAGREPVVLHGGYGSDEPALHRRWHPGVPVLVGRDRSLNARAAAAAGRDTVVLDDGFQHRRLARDLDIVLLAAEHASEPIRLLPRGPWREPLSALARADQLVVTRKTASAAEAAGLAKLLQRRDGRDPAVVWIRPSEWRRLSGDAVEPDVDWSRGAVAVAGIAEPESFFRTVHSMDVTLAARLAYPDHHDYTVPDVERILEVAGDRPIVMTAKDAVKLDLLEHVADVRVLEQRVEVEAGEEALVRRILESVR